MLAINFAGIVVSHGLCRPNPLAPGNRRLCLRLWVSLGFSPLSRRGVVSQEHTRQGSPARLTNLVKHSRQSRWRIHFVRLKKRFQEWRPPYFHLSQDIRDTALRQAQDTAR